MANASQSTKRQEMLEIWGVIATPMPAGDLPGPCGLSDARGHHFGNPRFRGFE